MEYSEDRLKLSCAFQHEDCRGQETFTLTQIKKVAKKDS